MGRSLLIALALLATSQTAEAACKLTMVAQIPITMVNNQPMVEAKINGEPAYLRFSLGYYPFLWRAAVQAYALPEKPVPKGSFSASGPGGKADVKFVHVVQLKIGQSTIDNIDMAYIDDAEPRTEAGYFGRVLAGFKQTDLTNYDYEYDLPHNAVRIFSPEGCKAEEVVYWGGEYTTLNLYHRNYFPIKIEGHVFDGVMAPENEVSYMTSESAQLIGGKLKPAGQLPLSMIADAMIKPVDVSIATFPELKIGDETIKNASIAVGDFFHENYMRELRYDNFVPQITLGADFAMSHRIYIAYSQKKIYFSYEGGSVFSDIYKRLGVDRPAVSPQ